MNRLDEPINNSTHLTRRDFIQFCAVALAATGVQPLSASAATPAATIARQVPLKLGIRAATMRMVGDVAVVQTAAGIGGIRGVELQVTAGGRNLRDWDVVRQYKAESERWDIRIPSLAGIWDKGVTVSSPKAVDNLQQSIKAAELLGSGVILAAFFKENAPDMNRQDSYGPVVDNLKKAATTAGDAGVVIGLETSLSPADNRKFVDLIAHPAVRVYYDLFNMASFGHGADAVPGVKLLGRERICAVHVKNGDKLIEEAGPIDWPAAFAAFNEIGYDGWFTYETAHKNVTACLADTVRNNAFLTKHIVMPTIGRE